MTLTYHSYLKVEELLSLQELKSPKEHDEMLFIIIHQTYELWFKEVMHELDYIIRMLEKGDVTSARQKMKRVLTIMKVLVHQVDILETMSPVEFLSFRNYLETASGFQSYQFRELEYLLGHKNKAHLERFPATSEIRKSLETRIESPSIWTVFLRYLHAVGYRLPEELLNPPSTASTESSEQVAEVLLEIYYKNPAIAQFCELLIDMDEGFQEWRYRHVKMVERTIGRKQGTGGSKGVEYLRDSLFRPLFPDLWNIRSSFGSDEIK